MTLERFSLAGKKALVTAAKPARLTPGRFSTSHQFRPLLRPICEDFGTKTDGKLSVAIS